MGEVKKVDINNPEIDWLIGTEAKVTLEEEIELLDGAAAEFDQELEQRRTFSDIFRFCTDQLWSGDIFAAFPCHDIVSSSENVRSGTDRPDEGKRFFSICI